MCLFVHCCIPHSTIKSLKAGTLFTAKAPVARIVPGIWLALNKSLLNVYILKTIWQYLVKLST